MGLDRAHSFSVQGKHFVCDVLTTQCFRLDSIGLSILPELLVGTQDNFEEKYAGAYPSSGLRKCIRECRETLRLGHFTASVPPYRHSRNDHIASLCLHVSHHCNLNCEYCYADAGSFGGKRSLMSQEVMRKAVDFAFMNSGDLEELGIGFFGGEPLLNLPVIQETVAYAKNRAQHLKKQVRFSMSTNATLLTRPTMDFLHRENFSLLFSLDGPARIHDRMRKDWKGRGTHACAMRNIRTFAKHFSPEFTVRGTFTRTTPNFTDQVLFLNDQGFCNISVEPAQLPPSHPHAITRDVELNRVKAEYDRLAHAYVERLRRGKPISFFHFDQCLEKLLAPRPTHTACGAAGGFIAVTPDGSIFPCFEAVVEKENCIGHLDTGFDKAKRRFFQHLHVDAKRGCRECWARYICGGGCHAFSIRYNGDIHIPYYPQCELFKYRFELSAWILSDVADMGATAMQSLRKHLGIES